MDGDVEQLVRSIHASPYKAAVYVTGGAAQVGVVQQSPERGTTAPAVTGCACCHRMAPAAASGSVSVSAGRQLPGCTALPQGMSWLLGVPGASSTVLEAVVPYSRGSLVELLGQVGAANTTSLLGLLVLPALCTTATSTTAATYTTAPQEPEQYCSADAALALARAAYQRAVVLSRFGEPVVGLGASCALASEPPKRGEHRAYLAAAGGDGARLLSLRLAKGQRTRWQEEQLVSRALLQVCTPGA